MRTLLAAICGALLLGASPAAAGKAPYTDQVVRLAITYQRHDERLPWAKTSPRLREAMGVVVEGPFILTTAQMVEDATFIEAEKGGGPGRANAKVRHIDREINLALLTVEDPEFFRDLAPVRPLAEMPLGEPVILASWKQGQLELSESRVARAVVDSGPTSSLQHLFFLVKSDFAGGGWAEPVFAGKRFAGITVSQDGSFAQVLPAAIAMAYLEAARAPGGYRPFGSLDFTWQWNRDRAVATWLGVPGEPRGVIVLDVPWGATGCGTLKARDVLLALDGREIDADGYYRHPLYGRLGLANLAVEGHRAGDRVRARIWREGREMLLDLELWAYPSTACLVPRLAAGRPPPYRVAGGMVFRELDWSYLAAGRKNWREEATPSLVSAYLLEKDRQRPDRRRIVILSFVLPDTFNVGYQDLSDLRVQAVNGIPVGNLADLAAGFARPVDGVHVITFAPNPILDEAVLDAASMADADAAIARSFRIGALERLDPTPIRDLGPLPCAE